MKFIQTYLFYGDKKVVEEAHVKRCLERLLPEKDFEAVWQAALQGVEITTDDFGWKRIDK